MQFGKGEFNSAEFKTCKKSFEISKLHHAKNELMIGLPQWAVRSWKGVLYPYETLDSDFLNEYAKRLSCVELSSTFYTTPSEAMIQNWCKQTTKGFKFLPKWPKRMTHDFRLKVTSAEIIRFLSLLEHFGDRLGVSLLQLPPDFSKDEAKSLFYFLEKIPNGFPLALELRHSSWFQEATLIDSKLFSYLQKRGFSLVVSDTPQRRDLFHLSSSGSHFVIRYLSDDSFESDSLRVQWWLEHAPKFLQHSQAYFIFHKSDHTQAAKAMSAHFPQSFEDVLKTKQIAHAQMSLPI